MSSETTIWIDEGQALLGEFHPAGTATDVPLIKVNVGPPSYPCDELRLFFHEGADLVATARTLRRITEALECTLWPELAPDWSNLPLGVMGE